VVVEDVSSDALPSIQAVHVLRLARPTKRERLDQPAQTWGDLRCAEPVREVSLLERPARRLRNVRVGVLAHDDNADLVGLDAVERAKDMSVRPSAGRRVSLAARKDHLVVGQRELRVDGREVRLDAREYRCHSGDKSFRQPESNCCSASRSVIAE